MTTNPVLHYMHRHFGGLIKRYHRFSHWFLDRLTTDPFKGLPLSVLIGLLLVSVLILSEIAENLVNSEPVVTHGRSAVHAVALSWTYLIGQPGPIRARVVWVGICNSWPGLTGVNHPASSEEDQKYRDSVGADDGHGLSVLAGKRTFIRPRPLDVAYYTETGYSFPSGHSATAMTLYGLLSYWLVRGRRRIRNGWLVGSSAVAMILLVGFSRIYLGVHFLSDVLGGYLLGTC